MDNLALQWKHTSKGTIQARFISEACVILREYDTSPPVYPQIGEGTWIGHFTLLDGSQGLTIGKHTDISSGVHIYTHSTHERCAMNGAKITGKVKIGDHVAIGANSIINYGCVIGNNVVIGALSMVKPHTIIRDHEFWAGNPAKLIRKFK